MDTHFINLDNEKRVHLSDSACHRRLILIKYIGEAMWILSEATWILLIPQVCIPSSFLALVLISSAAALDFKESRELCVWFPSAMQAFWLFWNSVWMLDEVFWDEPDEQTPWAQTPMFGTHENRYAVVQEYCKKGFFLAPVLWLAVVLLEVFRGLKANGTYSRHCWQSNVRELLCHSGYIAMWSSTDGFWACGDLWASNASAVVTIVMIIASTMQQTTKGITLQVDRSDVVWIVWTLSNLVWIYLELYFKDSMTVRYLSSLVCFASLLLLAMSWEQFRGREEYEATSCEDLASSLNKPNTFAVSK